MTWQSFLHWLTTSRYTRELEREIEQLRADCDRLRAHNDALLGALSPAIRAIKTEHQAITESRAPVKFKW